MKFNTFVEAASRIAHKAMFKVKKHSPEILMVAGTVSIIAGTVVACKSTLKIPAMIEEADKTLEMIHGAQDGTIKLKEDAVYTEDDAARDITIVYVQTAVKVLKVYAPAIILIGGGLGCMISSHIIMRKRYSAAVAAYAAVTKAFEEYKARVAERFGDDVQKEIETGIKAIDISAKDKDGNDVTVKGEQHDDKVDDPYSFLFDENNAPGTWEKDPELNRITLLQAQRSCMKKLKTRGYLFLNEALDSIGMRGTQIGQFAGWIYDPENPNIDSFIDFGIYSNDPIKQAFLDGYEPNIWLHFNCDGSIIDKI